MYADRSESTQTTLRPFAAVPGVIPLAYAIFVTLGIVVGLLVQASVLAGSGLPVRSSIAVSLLAVLAGVVTAKIFYVVGHRGRRFNGWLIQGFIVGATLVAVPLASARLPMSLGVYLDTMAPALLIGMAIGRIGCFFAGCCRGRLTATRWGVWSSDQRIGARRVPTQLLESLLAAATGIAALIAVVSGVGWMAGTVFVTALGIYTFGRQFVLPLRADPRNVRYGRSLVLVASAGVLVADILVIARGA